MPTLKSKSHWLSVGVLSMLNNFSTVILGFGSFFFLIRTLDKYSFGIWALFLSVTTIIEAAKIGFVKNGLIRFINSESKSSHGQIFMASAILNFGLTIGLQLLLLIISGLLARVWDAQILQMMLYWYSLNALFLVVFYQFEYLQLANFYFKGVLFMNTIRSGLFFIYVIIGYLGYVDLNLVSLVVSQAVAVFIAAITGVLLSLKFVYQFNKPKLIDKTFTWIRKLFSYGKYVTATNLSGLLYSSVDQFMIGVILSPVSVALYNAPNRIKSLSNIPTLAISAIVFPYSAKLTASVDKKGIRQVYQKSVGINLSILIPGVIFILAMPELVITIIAGQSYLEVVPLLQIIMICTLFVPYSRMFGTVLDSIGLPRINFYFTLTGLIINIIINYYLIIQFGVIGAVVGTLIANIIMFIGMQYYLFRKFSITIWNSLVEILDIYKSIITFLKRK